MTCDKHSKEFTWIEVSPGRRVWRCIDCHNKVETGEPEVHMFPKIKYAQNFWRSRDWLDIERNTPYGKPKKPKY